MNAVTRQLIRASLPARRALLRRRLGRVVLEEVDGISLVVLDQVFNPVVFRTGVLLARAAADVVSARADRTVPPPAVLDLGTGSGIGALYAARAGGRVSAVDINPEAVRCARINAMVNHLDERIEVLEGDLYEPVRGRRFDLVLFNPPFFRGTPTSPLDQAWRANDVLERFAQGLPGALAVRGTALIAFSSDGDEAGLLSALAEAGLTVRAAARHDLGSEVVTVHACRRGDPLP